MSFQEFESYSEVQVQETPRKKKRIVHEPVAVEDKTVKIAQEQSKPVRFTALLAKKTRAAKPESPTSSLIKEMEVDKEEDEERAVTTLEAPFVKPRKTLKKRRGEKILSKVCAIEVCKPEICCADLEGKLPLPTTAQTSFPRIGKAIYFFFPFSMRRSGHRGRTR